MYEKVSKKFIHVVYTHGRLKQKNRPVISIYRITIFYVDYDYDGDDDE